MAQEITIKRKCPHCAGDGWFGDRTGGPLGSGPHPCEWEDCNQTGYITWGKFYLEPGTDDLHDRQQDILDKLNDIIEMLTP